MPFTGLIELNTLGIIPAGVYGYQMFNFFFTLVMINGVIAWSLGACFSLFRNRNK